MASRGAAAARPQTRPQTPARPRPRPKAVPAARRRRRFRLRIRLGIAVIPLVGLLFMGIVYVNSAKLAVTKRQGQIATQMVAVQSEIARLQTRSAQSDAKVRKFAEAQGMTLPPSDEWVYVPARQRP